jgi:hypothetical protein
MHTNEVVYDTFIPRWFGRLGNNIQQISNGIYYCRKEGIRFTSPDHPMISSIDLPFGTKEQKLDHTKSNNWFYFYNGPDADFSVDEYDLNKHRKSICEDYILPNLKIDHSELLDPLHADLLVIHLRCGDLYRLWPATHPQNPLPYFLELLKLFDNNVMILAEDMSHPFMPTFFEMGLESKIQVLPFRDTYTYLLRAQNLASSGAGSYVISAALCSKNLTQYYCTDLYIENSLNPMMIKDHLNVQMMHLGDKYIKVGGWNNSPEIIDKLFNYKESILFRRL